MAGNKMGSLKRKLGLKGKTKPGEMLSRMNSIKNAATSTAVKGKPNAKDILAFKMKLRVNPMRTAPKNALKDVKAAVGKAKQVIKKII